MKPPKQPFWLTFWKVAVVSYILAGLLNSIPAKADWILIPGLSKHVHTETKHNQQNYGIGYEWEAADGRNWAIGTYRNSYWRQSSFVLTELTSYKFSDTIRIRLDAGAVTGYKWTVMPIALPVWTYENKRWGFDAITIPPVGGRMGVFAVQFKVKF